MQTTAYRTETEQNTVKIVIGSWGSYNACNERALGSEWLDLADFNTWDEIADELEREGFKLDGIDEELFIQDIEGFDRVPFDCDYMGPAHLFDVLSESGVLENAFDFKKLNAYLEVMSWDNFEQLVDDYGANWGSDIYFYEDQTLEDIAQQQVDDTIADLEASGVHDCWLFHHIDIESIARELAIDNYYEVTNGVIEIY